MPTIVVIIIVVIALVVVAVVVARLQNRKRVMKQLLDSGMSLPEAEAILGSLKGGDHESALHKIAEFQQRKRTEFQDATGIDLSSYVPTIGDDIAWLDAHLQIFRVTEFDKAGTTIDSAGRVQGESAFSPYGYLIVSSPILNQPVKLPIIHRDDFLLASSVFDEPSLAPYVDDEELLVVYAPRKVLDDGRSGEASHVLHYLLTKQGALENYYSADNDKHMVSPDPSVLFEPFAYEGEIKVQVNL